MNSSSMALRYGIVRVASLELTSSLAYSTLTRMKRSREMLLLLAALAAVAGVALVVWRWRAVAEPPAIAPSAAKREHAKAPPAPSAVPSARGVARVAFTLYFPSREYVETGKESVDRLVAESIMLEPALAAAGNDRLAAALLQALGRGPTSAAALPAIPARIRIRSIQVREGVAELDLARAGLSGGSLEEELFVRSTVQTLTRLPGLHAVRFLVEGRKSDTLMGHVSTAQPITASDW